jgi:hypothetical protein
LPKSENPTTNHDPARHDLDARIYLAWIPRNHRAVLQKLGGSLSEEEIRARLEFLRDARLMVEMEGHYPSVAVWRNRACES